MNTNTTQACGIGRPNTLIEPHELFRFTETPTALHALDIEGWGLWLIHRDAQGHPHFAPMQRDNDGSWFTTNIDGERFTPAKVTAVQAGDKIAFDHKGDVWIVAVDGPRPYFVEC